MADQPAVDEFLMSKIEAVEAEMLHQPQIEFKTFHRFAPNCYLREIHVPAGAVIIGHQHKTGFFNIMLKGRAKVFSGGIVHDMVAPCILVSEPGDRKMALVLEDLVWATFHPTNETDLARLEDELIIKSESFIRHSNAEAIMHQAISTQDKQ